MFGKFIKLDFGAGSWEDFGKLFSHGFPIGEIGFDFGFDGAENSVRLGSYMERYKSPGFKIDAFHCPHCGAYAHQIWYSGCGKEEKRNVTKYFEKLSISVCAKVVLYQQRNWNENLLIRLKTSLEKLLILMKTRE